MESFFNDIEMHISEELMSSTFSIKVAMSWFTNKRLLKILEYKQRNGIHVEILTNDDEINRKSLDFSTLIEAGGNVWFSNTEKALMHCKFCLIDNTTIITGSYNWTNKAEIANKELICIDKNNPQELEKYNLYFEKLKTNVINNDNKRTHRSKPNSNAPIRSKPNNWQYIKSPYLYTKIGAGFSLSQQQIMWKLIESIQSKPLLLSPPLKGNRDAFYNYCQKPTLIEIKLNDLKIAPEHYNDLEQTIIFLRNYDILISEFNQHTNKIEEKAIPLFETIDMPHSNITLKKEGKSQNRRRSLFLKLNSTAANIILKIDEGYIYHIADLVYFCKKKYTPRIYLLLKRLQQEKELFVSYIELKDYFGTQDKYSNWHDFRNRILDCAQTELSFLYEQGKSDIKFQYEPTYKNGRKRGEPSGIKFIIESIKWRTVLGRDNIRHQQTK